MIGKKPFVGKEVEGPDRGRTTLFIPNGSITKEQASTLLLLAEKHRYRVYLGAGEETGIDPICMDLAKELLKRSFQVVAEVQFKDLQSLEPYIPILNLIELVLVVPYATSPVLQHMNHVKLLGKERLYWYTIEDVFKNEVNDYLYNTDEEIEV